jgi:hypothetical protein
MRSVAAPPRKLVRSRRYLPADSEQKDSKTFHVSRTTVRSPPRPVYALYADYIGPECCKRE